jgi:hypothetical protein
VAIAALFGPQDARNPLPGVFYVMWVGLVALSLVVGPCGARSPRCGVIAAYDRALRLLPAGHQLTGQLAMMVMVGYTFTGLYLLFGG